MHPRVASACAAWTAVVVIMFLTVCSTTSAQVVRPSSSPRYPTPLLAPEELYQRGVEAFTAQHYFEAAEWFAKANAARPDGRLYFNIALAFDRAGDTSKALSNYRTYLLEADESEHAGRVTARVNQLEKTLAKQGVQQVMIRSEPENVDVAIDGRPMGVTPWTGDLKPGLHRVTLSHEGFEDYNLEFSLSLTAALTLSAPMQRLPVTKSQNAATTATSTNQTANSGTVMARRAPNSTRERPVSSRVPESLDGPPKSRVGPWVVVGAGAAIGLGAVGFELDRQDAAQAARIATSRPTFEDNVERMERSQTVARVLGTMAATSVALGLIWLFVSDDEDAQRSGEHALVPRCGVDGCTAGVNF